MTGYTTAADCEFSLLLLLDLTPAEKLTAPVFSHRADVRAENKDFKHGEPHFSLHGRHDTHADPRNPPAAYWKFRSLSIYKAK